jgi:uncharacterized protein (TIGR03083 family)
MTDMTDPADALEAETTRLGELLFSLTSEDWAAPTRCPPLNVRELAVHTLRGAYRIIDTFAADPLEGEPEKDAVTYWRYDPAAVGKGVVDRAKAESEARAPDADIASEWRDSWTKALMVAREGAEDDRLIPAIPGTTRLREFLKTRCIEVTIHGMDLRNALGLDPDPSAAGLEVACDVLRGILGTDLRPLGMDDVRFALVGTGRAQPSDAELEMLGPLADSLPLLQ